MNLFKLALQLALLWAIAIVFWLVPFGFGAGELPFKALLFAILFFLIFFYAQIGRLFGGGGEAVILKQWRELLEDEIVLMKKIRNAFDLELGDYRTARGWKYGLLKIPGKEYGVALMTKDGIAEKWKIVDVMKNAKDISLSPAMSYEHILRLLDAKGMNALFAEVKKKAEGISEEKNEEVKT